MPHFTIESAGPVPSTRVQMISGTDKVTYNLPPHIENHTNNSEGLGLEVVVQSSKKQKLMEGVSNERCMYPTSYDMTKIHH